MNKENIREIIYYVIAPIVLLIILISSIVTNDIKGIIFASIFIAIFIFGFLLYFYYNIKVNKYLKSIKKHYDQLKLKESRGIFEELYVSTFGNKIEDQLKSILESKRTKNINSFNAYIEDTNEVAISFKYSTCDVVINIDNKKVTYFIDTPSKYDSVEANSEFEKVKEANIYLDNYIDNELFYDSLIMLIERIQLEIDEFKIANVVDEFFNGRLLKKLEPLSKYFKREGYVCGILGTFITVLMFIVSYHLLSDIEYIESDFGAYVSGFICMLFIISFCVGVSLYGLNYVYKYNAMLNDIKNKRLTVINEEPKRVRIVRDQPSKYSSTRTLRYIKVYYDNITVLIPYKNYECVLKPGNIREACQECMEIKTQLKYLTKSKIVVSGGDKFIKISKKYLM